MSSPYRPGDLHRILEKVKTEGDRNAEAGLVALGQVVETEAKQNANSGSHRKGEGHVPGSGPGPNVVSGNLRRSITHSSPQRDATGPYVKVGTAGTAPYGKFLETGLRNGRTYPFLLPAARKIAGRVSATLRPFFSRW